MRLFFCAIWCVIEDFAHAVAWGGATKIAGATACDDSFEIANYIVNFES